MKATSKRHMIMTQRVFQQGQWHSTFHEPMHPIGPQTTDHISRSLVCTKTIQTVDAIRPLAGRLTAASTILLLQNGCGVIDVPNRELFKEEQNRPNHVIGVTSHGVGQSHTVSSMLSKHSWKNLQSTHFAIHYVRFMTPRMGFCSLFWQQDETSYARSQMSYMQCQSSRALQDCWNASV